MQFDTTITTADWVEVALRNGRDYLRTRRRRGLAAGFGMLATGILLGVLVGSAIDGRAPTPGDLLLLVRAPLSARGPFVLWLAVAVAFVLGRFALHDRLLRRRYRRWALREHGSAPVPTRYGVDDAGIVAADAWGRTRLHWAAVRGLEETDRHFFLLTPVGGATPVPKRDLSSADRDAFRAAVLARLPDPAGPPDPGAPALPAEVTAEAAVLARYEQGVPDRAAAALLLWNTPVRRRRRALLALALAVGLALGIVVLDGIGWWLGWWTGHGSRPFATAFAAFLRTEAAEFRGPALYAVCFGLGLWLLWPSLLRRQALANARTRADTPVLLALGPGGVGVATPGIEFHYAWDGVRALLEARDHVGLLLPFSVVLPIPKRALTQAQTLALRHLLAERIGPDATPR